jgi:hypothetical protein
MASCRHRLHRATRRSRHEPLLVLTALIVDGRLELLRLVLDDIE